MKTIKVGLIPISTLRLNVRGQISWLCCALFTILLTQGASAAGPDEWPEMAFYTPEDMIQPISNGHTADMAQALACKPLFQISLNEEGWARVTPTMMLPLLNYPAAMYSVEIHGPLSDTVFCDQIGQQLMATVREIPTGNTCMSQFTVEDKMPPVLTCIDDTLPCYTDYSQLPFEEFVIASDNCTPANELTIIYSYTLTELDCDPDNIAGRIDLMYTVTDNSGNTSTCEKSIYLEKFHLDSVDFPADTMISCINPDYSVENIGEPTIDGYPVDHFCELIS